MTLREGRPRKRLWRRVIIAVVVLAFLFGFYFLPIAVIAALIFRLVPRVCSVVGFVTCIVLWMLAYGDPARSIDLPSVSYWLDKGCLVSLYQLGNVAMMYFEIPDPWLPLVETATAGEYGRTGSVLYISLPLYIPSLIFGLLIFFLLRSSIKRRKAAVTTAVPL